MQTRSFFLTALAVGALLGVHNPVWAQLPDAPPAVPLDAPVPTSAPPTLVLRYKYQPGQVIRYKMTQDIDQKMSLSPLPFKMHLELITKMTVLKVDAADGAATIKSQMETFEVTNNGKIVAIPESARTTMQKGTMMTILPNGQFPKTPLGGVLPQIYRMSPGSLGFFQATGNLPDSLVKIGSVWNTTTQALGLTVHVKSKLKGIDIVSGKTIADIEKSTDIRGIMALPTPNKAVTMKMNMNTQATGLMHFDVDAGILQSETIDMKMSSTIIMPSNPDGHTHTTHMPGSFEDYATMHMKLERIEDAL